MKDHNEAIAHEEYICEDCGTTTPVQNESCPNCGGKLIQVDGMREPTDHELSAEEDDLESLSDVPESGTESLESLAAEELDEDHRSYHEDNYGDDE